MLYREGTDYITENKIMMMNENIMRNKNECVKGQREKAENIEKGEGRNIRMHKKE